MIVLLWIAVVPILLIGQSLPRGSKVMGHEAVVWFIILMLIAFPYMVRFMEEE